MPKAPQASRFSLAIEYDREDHRWLRQSRGAQELKALDTRHQTIRKEMRGAFQELAFGP